MPTSIINIVNDYPRIQLLKPKVTEIVGRIQSEEKHPYKQITIIVTDDETVRRLKHRYFNENVYTDTISINYNRPNAAIEGEIYLSMDRIIENADQYANPLRTEVALVLIHSLLHLIGYDDQTAGEKAKMEARQNQLLNSIDCAYLIRKSPRQ